MAGPIVGGVSTNDKGSGEAIRSRACEECDAWVVVPPTPL